LAAKLVVATRNTPTLLDFVEEPLHQIASTMEVGVAAVSFRWDVRPSAVLIGECWGAASVTSCTRRLVSASVTSYAVIVALIDRPTIRGEKRTTTAAT
jgi:hypothetical protein